MSEIQTVGDLIARLQAYDPASPLRGAAWTDEYTSQLCEVRGLKVASATEGEWYADEDDEEEDVELLSHDGPEVVWLAMDSPDRYDGQRLPERVWRALVSL